MRAHQFWPDCFSASGSGHWEGESVPVSDLQSQRSPHSISAPETLTLGSGHQAEEKTPHPCLLHHHPAFPDTSALWEEGCELPQPRGGLYPGA